ncbi:MAG: hypothetical protein Q4G21_06115 [Dermabacter sp.]|nr:hypothetical protein [Dermabacter sp.]
MQALTRHDDFLWHTLRINELLDADRYQEIPTVPVTFAPMPHDIVWGSAPLHLYRWAAPGNGTYTRDDSFFIATGGLGLALSAGVALGRAAGNNARRRQAQFDSVPRWMPIDQGAIYVSNLGFYLAVPGGLHTWTWESVSSMQLVHPAQVTITGTSDNGPIHWLMATDAAELLFTLWARVRHPAHPQYSTRSWLPQGWFERVQAAGRPLPSITQRGS